MAVANVQTLYKTDHFKDVKGSSSIPLINNVVSDEDLRKAVQKVKLWNYRLAQSNQVLV